MITLNQYLKQKKINVNQFAKMHGIPQPTVRRAALGTPPRPKVAMQIAKATKGEVSLWSLLYPGEPEQQLFILSGVINVLKEYSQPEQTAASE